MSSWVMKAILSGIVLVVSYILFVWIFRMIIAGFSRIGREIKIKNTLKMILGVFIFVVDMVIIFNIWNLNVLSLLTGLGIGGIIIGLALQEPLANFFSGLFLMMSGTLREGESVEVGDVSGVVDVIHLNHTIIRTWDGRKVLIPNKMAWNEKITHLWPGEKRRVEMTVGVSYNSDLRKVLEILKKALEDEETVEKEPNFDINFIGFSSSSVDFKLKLWVKRQNYFNAQKNLAIRIKEYFEEAGIEIPYPQVDVHLKDGSFKEVDHEGKE
ncbi:MAG: mechanosensitive ion channel family protein [Thermotoga sp.]|nr:MAG: mechanosensitive ion channel family protein [Thermotoga sp.]